MIDRTTRLRWRRKYRRKKRQVEDMSVQAEEHFEKHFFRRISRLFEVRRFIIAWLLLFGLLGGVLVYQIRALQTDYQMAVPVAGGIYTEGVIGAFTNANPLYAAGAVDNTVSRLLFSSLLKYDQNNVLVGDLASNWSPDPTGRVYTVTLKDNLHWHDGKDLTADDVVFTYRTIKNPDAKSPLLTSWRGIKIEAKDKKTVVFTLPNVLSSFPYALTNGIVPKYYLESVPATQLRSVRFNTVAPVGSGPFRWDTIEVVGTDADSREEQIGLSAYDQYHGGQPKLDKVTVRSFRSEKAMLASFKNQELNAMSGLDSLPDDIDANVNPVEHNIPLTGQVVVFLKNSNDILKDQKVRRALIQAADPVSIIAGLQYPVIASQSPLLSTHLGFSEDIKQLPPNIEAANKLLDEAGWTKGNDGIRVKAGVPLSFRLFSQNTSEYAYVTQKLQEQWRAIGVDMQTFLQPDDEFEGTISRHEYDALLYGISLGLDPDVFPYWHSSQADFRSDTRLNFSEYKSTAADKALEAGRTRSDVTLRGLKYKPFLEAWRNDAPALVLYQPRFLYVTSGDVYGFDPKTMNTATDRFANIQNWMIREEYVNR
jgi:peptide/nickel transport system substrate-binding protein